MTIELPKENNPERTTAEFKSQFASLKEEIRNVTTNDTQAVDSVENAINKLEQFIKDWEAKERESIISKLTSENKPLDIKELDEYMDLQCGDIIMNIRHIRESLNQIKVGVYEDNLTGMSQADHIKFDWNQIKQSVHTVEYELGERNFDK